MPLRSTTHRLLHVLAPTKTLGEGRGAGMPRPTPGRVVDSPYISM